MSNTKDKMQDELLNKLRNRELLLEQLIVRVAKSKYYTHSRAQHYYQSSKVEEKRLTALPD